MNNLENITGIAASVLTAATSIPQLIKIIKEKREMIFLPNAFGSNNRTGIMDTLWIPERGYDTHNCKFIFPPAKYGSAYTFFII